MLRENVSDKPATPDDKVSPEKIEIDKIVSY